MATRNKTSAARARSLQRQAKALDLRRAGHSHAEIAAKLGIGKTQAFRLISAGLEAARAQISHSSDELKADELARLDGMLTKAYPLAAKGDLQAIDRVLKIGERRAKLLGLDAPTRTALQGGGDDAPPIATTTEATVTFYIPENGRG